MSLELGGSGSLSCIHWCGQYRAGMKTNNVKGTKTSNKMRVYDEPIMFRSTVP